MDLTINGPLQPSQLAVLLPALGGVLTILLVRRSSRLAAGLALLFGLAGVVAAGLLVAQQLEGDAVQSPETIGALPLGGALSSPLHLYVDRWSVLVCAAVAVVSFVVQAFARWYLWTDPRYRQFAATVGVFTAAMQLVVLSGDLVLTVVGWEVMGWCSYLLIGHDSERARARRAAYKAFIVTRIADAPFIIGMAALAIAPRSTDIPTILKFWQQPGHVGLTLSLAMLCVVCGVLGKSAQIPFQDWLPDAMEGPTPASALIHAATMVAAGTVVLARLQPLVETGEHVRLVLVILAGASTVLAAALAFAQHDLKRLLAWSTVSQVGIMLVAIAIVHGNGSSDTAITHLLGHAMFKALLFLMFGWLSVLVGGTVAPRLSGAVRRHPTTRSLTAVGLLALAGVPPLVGFVSKDLIIDNAAHGSADGDLVAVIGFVCLGITTVLTAAYAARAWLVLQHRTTLERRVVVQAVEDSHRIEDVGIVELLRDSPQVDESGHEIGSLFDEFGDDAAGIGDGEDPYEDYAFDDEFEMDPHPGSVTRMGLVLLALLSIAGGAVVASPLLDIDWQEPNWFLVAASLLLMVAAALLVRVMSLGTTYGDAADRLPMWWRSAASRGLNVDRLYLSGVAKPVLALANVVAAVDHRYDKAIDSSASLARRVGNRVERAHTRRPTSGLLAVVAGVIVTAVLGVTLW